MSDLKSSVPVAKIARVGNEIPRPYVPILVTQHLILYLLLLEQGLRCWLVSSLPTALTPPNEIPRPNVPFLETQHLILYLLSEI